MTRHGDNSDESIPYQRLVDHFNRPDKSVGTDFDPDDLPEGEPRELYDTVMAEYYSHIPTYPAKLSKEKSKFDLIARTRKHVDQLAEEAQSGDQHTPEILETSENKQLSHQEIQRIVASYKGARRSTRP
jgi:hypothetical protein